MSDLDQGVSKNTRGCQIYTGLVSNLDPNDTEYSETNNKDTELVISDEDEERFPRNSQIINKTDFPEKLIKLASMIRIIFMI